jgi:hypothetical protein
MYSDKSDIHHKEIFNKYMSEEASAKELQMAVQHRLDNNPNNNNINSFDGIIQI